VNPDYGRILLVEDNPSDVELILHGFGLVGIAPYVKVVYDGDEALTYLLYTSDMRPPEVVILDLKLPKINGWEVLRQIRNTPSMKELPVVVFTSSREPCDIQESKNYGVDLYLV